MTPDRAPKLPADHAPNALCAVCGVRPDKRSSDEPCGNCGDAWICHFLHVRVPCERGGYRCRVVTEGACCAEPCERKCRAFVATYRHRKNGRKR